MTTETNRVSHTPGPWVYFFMSSGVGERFAIGPAGGRPIVAFVEQDVEDGCNLTGGEVEANARLIAAAPEMADAGNTLAAYVYALFNPGEIPEHVKAAMRTFQAVS